MKTYCIRCGQQCSSMFRLAVCRSCVYDHDNTFDIIIGLFLLFAFTALQIIGRLL